MGDQHFIGRDHVFAAAQCRCHDLLGRMQTSDKLDNNFSASIIQNIHDLFGQLN